MLGIDRSGYSETTSGATSSGTSTATGSGGAAGGGGTGVGGHGGTGTGGHGGFGGLGGSGGSGGAGGTGGTGGAPTCDPACAAPKVPDCETVSCVAGACQAMFAKAGKKLAKQTPGDCKAWLCDGKGDMTQSDDNADKDDGNDCTDDACKVGVATHTPSVAEQPCWQSGGNFCDGKGACVACVSTPDCADAKKICDAHVCVGQSCKDGQKNGSETDVDCGGADCAPCGDSKACLKGTDCTSQLCDAGKHCAAPGCGDGVKNGSETDVDCGGSCAQKCGPNQGCAKAGDCVGLDCNGATCVPNCLDKVKNGLETDVDCGGGVCGQCADAKLCKAPADCTSNGCCAGTCSACCDGVKDAMETDVDCGGSCAQKCSDGLACKGYVDCLSQLCQGFVCKAGTCSNGKEDGDETDVDCGGSCSPCVQAKFCGKAGDCANGLCVDGVCCDGACDGACKACNLGGAVGTCMNIALNGTDNSPVCSGANACDGAGACKKVTGQTCAVPGDCVTGSCADSVCCNAACGGLCSACSAALTGVANGTCAPIPPNTDPNNECATDAVSTCGQNGVCNGANACAKYDNATVCLAASCAGGTQTTVAKCNGSGTCVAGVQTPCTPYVCGGNACASACADDAGCIAADYCATPGANGVCKPKVAQGGACSGLNQCSNGSVCVDGFCCNAVCNGVCEACSAVKTGVANGTCAPMSANTDPDNECAGAAGAEMCGTGNKCQCSDVVKDGTGGATETDVDCGGGVCGKCAAGKLCNGAADCASGTCNAGKCGAVVGPPSCQADGDGLTNCGPNSNESCCASPLVTGGTFKRSYDGLTYLNESYPAEVANFRLDKYEITVGRFRQFIAAWDDGWRPASGAGKHTHLNSGSGLANSANAGSYEAGWDGASWNAGLATTNAIWSDASHLVGNATYATWTSSAAGNERRPINYVTWFEVYAFCIWDGGFLPSEAEWNYAAAGGSAQREYPWPAQSIDCSYANYNNGAYCSATYTNNVGTDSPKGDGKFGQADLAGNVWEWNLDWYASPYGKYDGYVVPRTNCAYLAASSVRVIRGGSFGCGASSLLASNRHDSTPANRVVYVGARCSRTP